MKKKFWLILLTLLTALCLALGISACGDKTPADQTGDGSTQTEQPGGEQKPDEGQGGTQKPDEGQGGSQTTPGGGTQTPHVHAYGDWDIISAATHTQTGIRRKYCSCGEYIEESIPKTTAHEYGNWQTTREATHLQEGEEQRTCPCGTVEKQSIPKTTAHEYGNWIVTEEASCTQTGQQYHECPCGHTESEVIPKKAHSYTDCVCDTCGAIEPGAVEVKVYIDNQYQNSLYTGASNGYKIQLPDYWEDYRYFDGWYANTEYMEPLTGDETYQTSSVIYGRWIPFLNYKVTVNKGEATIVKCNSTTATAVVVPSGCGDSNVNYPITSIAADAFKGMTMIRWLIICSPMRTIGSSAFEGCNSMKKVVLPDTLTSIGDRAFKNCSFIEKLEIPDGVTEIEDATFYGCSGLTGELKIPDGVTSIGSSAFGGCSGLESVTIGSGVTSIGWSAFSGCSRLESVIWNAENCTDVGMYSNGNNQTIFQSCTNLSTVTFGKNVKTVPAYAFYGCSGMTGDLKIPDSVASIGEYAFLDCNGLESVTIGSGMTSIGNYAFSGCNGLTGDLKIPDGVTSIGDEAFSGCSGLTGDLKIPDSVTSIGDNAFDGCSGLESVTIGSGVTSIGDRAFYGCSGLESVIWNAENCTYAGYYYSNGNNDTIFQDCTNLSKAVFGENVKKIPAYAFYNCSGLTGELKIPDGVTSIGSFAFRGCSGLTGELKIPDGMTSIGSSAFSGCSGLTGELKIPDSVTSIGAGAFGGCSGLEKIEVAAGNPNYSSQDGILYNKEKTEFIHIPKAIKGAVTIPDSVTSIGWAAFSGCSGLTSITIPDSVTTIETSAFKGCSGLTSITIPDSVTTIEASAFSGCSGLSSATIGSSASSKSRCYLIGESAFKGCSSLRTITIPKSVCYIGKAAFSGCKNLTELIFEDADAHWFNGESYTGQDSQYLYDTFFHTSIQWSSTVTSFSDPRDDASELSDPHSWQSDRYWRKS